MIVSAPMNEEELRNMMYTAQLKGGGPFSIRYPRGKGVMIDWKTHFRKIEVGTGRSLSEGEDVAILTIGHVGNFANEVVAKFAQDNIQIGHYDMRFVKPLDLNLLKSIFERYNSIVTVEDGCLQGGFGSAVLEAAADMGKTINVKRLGIPDRVVEHGEQGQLQKECGFDAPGIYASVKKQLSEVYS